MMCFSGLSIISYIFDLLEILLSVSNHIQLWNHLVLYHMGSQSAITVGIKSTLFTLCLWIKLTLAHYRYICCFIFYTFYGCFFEGYLRWFHRWPVCSLFHKAYNKKGGSSEEDLFPDWSKMFSQGSGRRKWYAPCWPGPDRSPVTVTIEKILVHSL